MSEDFKKKEPIEELRERITKLEADVAVLCMPLSDRDFPVFSDPKKMQMKGVTYRGVNVSQIRDDEYLYHLANYLDWQGFMSFAKGTAEEVKIARYRHRDAAKCRYWKAQLFKGGKKKPSGGGGEAPF